MQVQALPAPIFEEEVDKLLGLILGHIALFFGQNLPGKLERDYGLACTES